MVMYRVDGVSGLNVLTGIKSIFHVSSLWSGRPSFLFLLESVIGLQIRLTNLPSFQTERSGKPTRAKTACKSFFEKFWGGKTTTDKRG
jgi:hypothetical protein